MRPWSRWVLVLCVLASGSCLADEGGPVINRLDRRDGPPGSAIQVLGSGFGADVSVVQATLGGKPCLVTDISDGELHLLSAPDCALGPGHLVLTVAGRAAAEQRFEVLDPAKLTEEYWRRRTAGAEVTARARKEKQRNAMLRIESMSVEPRADGRYLLRVSGRTAQLAPGFRLALQVLFGERLVSNDMVFIDKDRFEALLGPYQRELFPGRYTARVSFFMGRQRRSLRRRWIQELGLEQAHELQSLTDWRHFELGDLARADELCLDIRRRYAAVTRELGLQLVDLQRVYASTVRCLFRKGMSIDMLAWEQWVISQRFVSGVAELEDLRAEKRYVRGTYLDGVGWERHIRGLLMELRRQALAIETIGGEFLVPRYPAAQRKLWSLLSILFDLARMRTRVLFERSELPVPADLWTDFGFSPFDPSPRSTVGRFRTVLRQLTRDLDLDAIAASAIRPAEAEPPAKTEREQAK